MSDPMKQSTSNRRRPPTSDRSSVVTDHSQLRVDNPAVLGLSTKVLLVGLVGILVLLLAYLAFKQLTPPKSLLPAQTDIIPVITTGAVDRKPTYEAENSVTLLSANEDMSLPRNDEADVPNLADDKLIPPTQDALPEPSVVADDKVPESNRLAKEEIDRLEDEYNRLTELEKIAKQNQQLIQDLTEKKASQIELLEQQVTQLESQRP